MDPCRTLTNDVNAKLRCLLSVTDNVTNVTNDPEVTDERDWTIGRKSADAHRRDATRRTDQAQLHGHGPFPQGLEPSVTLGAPPPFFFSLGIGDCDNHIALIKRTLPLVRHRFPVYSFLFPCRHKVLYAYARISSHTRTYFSCHIRDSY